MSMHVVDLNNHWKMVMQRYPYKNVHTRALVRSNKRAVQSNLLFVHGYVGACCQKENETCFCRILDFSQRCFTSFLVDFNFTLMPFASQAAFRQSTNNVMGSLLFHFFRFHM